MPRIHHVQIVCIQTVTRILLHVYVCLEVKDFICSSDCIMHNMSFGKSGVGDSYTCHFVYVPRIYSPLKLETKQIQSQKLFLCNIFENYQILMTFVEFFRIVCNIK